MKSIISIVIVVLLSVVSFSSDASAFGFSSKKAISDEMLQRGIEDAVFFATDDPETGLPKTKKVVDIKVLRKYEYNQVDLEKVYTRLLWERKEDTVLGRAMHYYLSEVDSRVIYGEESGDDYKENMVDVIFQAYFITEDGQRHKIVCEVTFIKFQNKMFLKFPGGVNSIFRWVGDGPQNFDEVIRKYNGYVDFFEGKF